MTQTEGLITVLKALTTASFYTTVQLALFTNDIVITPSLVATDLEEPSFTGYSAASPTLAGTPWTDSDGSAVQSFVGAHFQPTDAAVSSLIFGWFIIKTGTGVKLLQAVRLPNPVTLAGPEDALDITPYFRLTPGGN